MHKLLSTWSENHTQLNTYKYQILLKTYLTEQLIDVACTFKWNYCRYRADQTRYTDKIYIQTEYNTSRYSFHPGIRHCVENIECYINDKRKILFNDIFYK